MSSDSAVRGNAVGLYAARGELPAALHGQRPGGIALAAAYAALGDVAHLARSIASNRDGLAYFEAEFERLGLPFIPSIGNFVSFELPTDAAPVYQALLREGVIVRPIGAYGMPHHLRVSVGLREENQRFIQALERVLN